MKKKIFFIASAILIGLCLLIIFKNYAQEYEGEVASIEKILKEHEAEANNWRNTARILLFLTVLVGILGVTAGILQRCNKKKCKIATVIAGGVIGAITLINNTAFEVDHRTYANLAREARAKIHEIRVELARGYPEGNVEARDEWFNKIQNKLHEMPTLTASFNNSVYNASNSFSLIPSVYAGIQEIQTREPSWIHELPADRNNLFFAGVGESVSLDKAKEYSFFNAVERAVGYLTVQFEVKQESQSERFDLDALSEYLVRSGQIEDTFFKYDGEIESYRYFTLFKLNKKNVDVDMRLFSIQQKVQVPIDLNQAIRDPDELPEDYHLRIMNAEKNFMDSTREALTPEKYEIFMDGYMLRKKGKYEESIERLEQIVEESPEFFLGWYYLALAFDGLNDFPRAGRAYERATELEIQQEMKDASFYYSYGYFLYRHERYEEAIPQLNKALEIDPDHPRARRILEAAEKAIR